MVLNYSNHIQLGLETYCCFANHLSLLHCIPPPLESPLSRSSGGAGLPCGGSPQVSQSSPDLARPRVPSSCAFHNHHQMICYYFTVQAPFVTVTVLGKLKRCHRKRLSLYPMIFSVKSTKKTVTEIGFFTLNCFNVTDRACIHTRKRIWARLHTGKGVPLSDI